MNGLLPIIKEEVRWSIDSDTEVKAVSEKHLAKCAADARGDEAYL